MEHFWHQRCITENIMCYLDLHLHPTTILSVCRLWNLLFREHFRDYWHFGKTINNLIECGALELLWQYRDFSYYRETGSCMQLCHKPFLVAILLACRKGDFYFATKSRKAYKWNFADFFGCFRLTSELCTLLSCHLSSEVSKLLVMDVIKYCRANTQEPMFTDTKYPPSTLYCRIASAASTGDNIDIVKQLWKFLHRSEQKKILEKSVIWGAFSVFDFAVSRHSPLHSQGCDFRMPFFHHLGRCRKAEFVKYCLAKTSILLDASNEALWGVCVTASLNGNHAVLECLLSNQEVFSSCQRMEAGTAVPLSSGFFEVIKCTSRHGLLPPTISTLYEHIISADLQYFEWVFTSRGFSKLTDMLVGVFSFWNDFVNDQFILNCIMWMIWRMRGNGFEEGDLSTCMSRYPRMRSEVATITQWIAQTRQIVRSLSQMELDSIDCSLRTLSPCSEMIFPSEVIKRIQRLRKCN